MKKSNRFVLFTLDNHQFALYLSDVERIALAVEITPLPNAPGIVSGMINVRGKIIPVVNIRKRFGFPDREIELENHFIIGRTTKRSVAILVDRVTDIVEIPEQKIVEQRNILPGIEYVQGVVKLEGDIVLINNLEKFLSIKEEKTLHRAIEKQSNVAKSRGKDKK